MYNEYVWNIYHEPTSSKEKDILSDGNPETYSKSDDEFSNSDKDNDIQNKGKYQEGFTSRDKFNKDICVYDEHKYLKKYVNVLQPQKTKFFVQVLQKSLYGKDISRK